MAAAWAAPSKLPEDSNVAGLGCVQMRHSSRRYRTATTNATGDLIGRDGQPEMSICHGRNPRWSWRLKLSRWSSDALTNTRLLSALAWQRRTLRPWPFCQSSSPITCFQLTISASHATVATSVTEPKDSLGTAPPCLSRNSVKA